MPTPPRPRRLWDTYRFPGFRPHPIVTGIFGDPYARIIRLVRRSKKRPVEPADGPRAAGTTAGGGASGISPAAISGSTSTSRVVSLLMWKFMAQLPEVSFNDLIRPQE